MKIDIMRSITVIPEDIKCSDLRSFYKERKSGSSRILSREYMGQFFDYYSTNSVFLEGTLAHAMLTEPCRESDIATWVDDESPLSMNAMSIYHVLYLLKTSYKREEDFESIFAGNLSFYYPNLFFLKNSDGEARVIVCQWDYGWNMHASTIEPRICLGKWEAGTALHFIPNELVVS